MSKFKDFILHRKALAFKKSRQTQIPEQGSFVTLFNNSYKVLTKPDSKIAILEDNRSNKLAYSRESLTKMLSESVEDRVIKADGNGPRTLTGSNKLVGTIGQNAKPKASGAPAAAGGKPAKAVDPVGTVRNGRKKVVSKKTGNTMWVDIATGTAHSEHNTHEPQQSSPEAEKQSKSFFDSLGDKIHSSDKIKLERQMKDLVQLKQRIQNSLDLTHQDDRQKAPEAQLSRKKVFALQDEYKKAFKDFQESVKASAVKAKKESGNET